MVRDAGNFTNVLHTMVTRHQLMLAYYLEMPSVFKPSIETGNVSIVSVDILDFAIIVAIGNKFKGHCFTHIHCVFTVNGTKYSKGMVVSAGHTSGLPDFERLLEICIVDGHIFFVIELFTAGFLEHLRCYHLTKKDAAVTVTVQPEELNDYIPLVANVTIR